MVSLHGPDASHQPMEQHLDEIHVEQTTPQGTQEMGVESGHEERDINIRGVMGWFTGLGLLTVVTLLLMWGMFALMAYLGEKQDTVPSPMFMTENQPKAPAPQLLPDPALAYQREKSAEDAHLKEIGLEDRRGLPALPNNAVSLVTEPSHGTQSDWKRMKSLPSDASGSRAPDEQESSVSK